jgi:hypothetical protein
MNRFPIHPEDLLTDVMPAENGLEKLLDYINAKIMEVPWHLKERGSILVVLDQDMIWVRDFKLYGRDNQVIANWLKLCDLYERAGWSCRFGLMHRWAERQGLQRYGFEVSDRVKFKYRDALMYAGELVRGSNDVIINDNGVFKQM